MSAVTESLTEMVALSTSVGRVVLSACAASVAMGLFGAMKRRYITRERYEAAKRSM